MTLPPQLYECICLNVTRFQDVLAMTAVCKSAYSIRNDGLFYAQWFIRHSSSCPLRQCIVSMSQPHDGSKASSHGLRCGQVEVLAAVQRLLERGLDPNGVDLYSQPPAGARPCGIRPPASPLQLAVKHRHTAVVQVGGQAPAAAGSLPSGHGGEMLTICLAIASMLVGRAPARPAAQPHVHTHPAKAVI